MHPYSLASLLSEQKKNPPNRGIGYSNINPQEPPRSCMVERISSYSGSGRLHAVNLLRIASNDSQRHNVHLRRLGTAGIYPFQCLLKLLFSRYSDKVSIPHFTQIHNFCFQHILNQNFVNLVKQQKLTDVSSLAEAAFFS